jgi:hypothetical protein
MHIQGAYAHLEQTFMGMYMVQTSELRRYALGDRVYVTAQQLWLILTGFVMWDSTPNRDKRITYGQLALKAGYSSAQAGHMLGRQLGIVGNFCLQNDLPALNAIVVTQHTGMPGDEVVRRHDRSVPEEQNAVLNYNWYLVAAPTTGMLRKVWQNME